ncbi:pneumococcal-type histidine triad protein [Streptococcus ovuberis]|uniref:Pneumococcal-type histidine triad protein n=1 Tax=Streptococcus ovuberis TaxID=1936207 RepID=A0A7X6MZP8_9STRE|nr:pneumococcal-type histidine triad protein [Streptococcus ovuberis]NKZ19359.1 pneumococcal-type histidine triad protein [Streptococcus ovuberis]
MKKKKWLPLTGLVLVCHLALTACQTKTATETTTTSTSQTTSSSSKKTPSSDKKQESLITEIKADGYTILVDGQSKFVKGKVPKDAKFSEETLAPKDYKLDKKDVQYEVEQGYIIKLKDRFYYYPKEKSASASKGTEKAIPGVTVPTSDGFQLADDSKILSKTKDGIVVDHDGHSHFIFYSDLKDTKFAHLIPQGADLSQKPSSTIASATTPSGKTSANDGHHYVFNPADIVAEDEFGYTVRHDDHFHYIPKSSLGGAYASGKPANGPATNSQAPGLAGAPSNQAETPTEPEHSHTPIVPEKPHSSTSPGVSSPSGKIAGIDHPTSDGFLFDGSGIKGWTDLGLLVDHDGHLHLIPKSDLARSKWKHLLKEDTTKPTPPTVTPKPSSPEKPIVTDKPQTPEQPVDPIKPEVPAKPEVSTKPEAPAEPEGTTKPEVPAEPESSEADILAEKQAYLAKELGLNPEDIQITDQNGQKLFVYPHGNHSHAIAADKVIIGQPIEDPHADPHAHQAVGATTLKTIGFDDEIIQDILHADAPTPFPATETNPEKMKAWLATVTSLNIGQRENALKRFGLDLMPNLETLGVGFTKIDDVTPILKFKQLKNLFLTDTGITDYSFLKELPNLEGIDISQNGLTSLDFLKDYPQLKTLAVTGSNLTDISVLSHLPNLESLNLDYNQLTDLTPLANLSKLKVVSLDHNKITDLSPLSQKSDLTRLFVSHNDGVKLATLKAPNLEELTAEHSGLTSLGFLKHLPSLVDLNANHNAISSLSGVDRATNLRTLNVSENQISSLRLPTAPAKLETLNVSHNRLTTLEGIQNFTALEQLNAGHNQLSSLSLSQPNKTITYLEVNNNHIPAEELEPNEQNIPNGIARNFPLTRGGDISENSAVADSPKEDLPTETDTPEQPVSESELSDVEIKRNYIAKHTNLPAEHIVLMETDKGQAFLYPHGNHHHVVYLKDIDVTQPFDDGHGNKQTMPPAPTTMVDEDAETPADKINTATAPATVADEDAETPADKVNTATAPTTMADKEPETAADMDANPLPENLKKNAVN